MRKPAFEDLSPRWALVVSLVAFLLHFVWESVQCIPLFVHGQAPESGFIAAMAWASLGDVLLTWLLYVGTALSVQDAPWPLRARWKRRAWVAMESIAVVLGIAIELIALRSGRWSYTALNPVLPGIGVSVVPVLQLMLLTPATFWLARQQSMRRDAGPGW